ncbi:MAG TPA: rhomboid family intramembrane serine protease [Opitutaceae bacterium]|nr:rhomboid family intramembrane serine protease [Opitutaceae bacterium]
MIPYRIETLFQHEPWANKVLFGSTIATSLAIQFDAFSEETVRQFFVWGEGGPLALVGYLFAHAGIAHLVGNMVFLWVFGNAVCATVGNWTYLGLYLGLGAFAGLVHQLVGGGPVVGASGAITGVVGVAVAFYPTNRVNLFYWLGMIPRTGRVWLWAIALYWTAWDVIGAVFGLGQVAYWAHLGGTAAGLATGLLLLGTARVQLTEFDDGSLLDFFLRRPPPHRQQAGNADTFAELRRAELAFASSQAAPSARAPEHDRALPPTPHQDTPRPSPLGRATASAPAANLESPLSQPTIVTIQPVVATNPFPRLKTGSLPNVRYFLFDRQTRHGPLSRAELILMLAGAPDTTGWWFWGEGMPDWQSVETLNAETKRSPYRLAKSAMR